MDLELNRACRRDIALRGESISPFYADFAESRLFGLMGKDHFPSLHLYLTTKCKDRGYALPKGTALNSEVTNNLVIQSVTIEAVKSGDFLDDIKTIEGELGTPEPDKDD
jgi:hypothetical protein